MRINYKLYFMFIVLLISLFLIDTPVKAVGNNRVINQTSMYSMKGLTWYMVAGQKKYSSSFYVEAGESIVISVAPSVSSAKYNVGIYQPSGSERKMTKSGSTVTSYSVSTSGYYKVFIYNANSTAVDYAISYAY